MTIDMTIFSNNENIINRFCANPTVTNTVLQHHLAIGRDSGDIFWVDDCS